MDKFGWRHATTISLDHEYTYVMYHEAHGICGVGHSKVLSAARDAAWVAAEAATKHRAVVVELPAVEHVDVDAKTFALRTTWTLGWLKGLNAEQRKSFKDQVNEEIK